MQAERGRGGAEQDVLRAHAATLGVTGDHHLALHPLAPLLDNLSYHDCQQATPEPQLPQVRAAFSAGWSMPLHRDAISAC